MSRLLQSSLVLWALLSALPVAAEPAPRSTPYSEADMLPVHSVTLTPGEVRRRTHLAPGLPALFLIGDDPRSQVWLRERLPTLQRLKAIGLVVQVDSLARLEKLRKLAPGLTLSPASADDLAQRLKLEHYPVLITAGAIEQ